MTTENTKFVYDNGFILLHDLERWHSSGYLNLKRSITIVDEGCPAEQWVIGDLFKIHGSSFPFRRGNTPAVTQNLEDCVYTSHQLLEEWKNGRKAEIKLPEDIWKELRKAVPVDWPLFSVENEPEEDRITGEAVVRQMKKITWKINQVLRRWNPSCVSYFSFLDKSVSDDETPREAVCRLCNYYPPNSELFLDHFFKPQHLQNLQNEQVSQRSFDFWFEKLEECLLECETTQGSAGAVEERTVSETDEVEESTKYSRLEKMSEMLNYPLYHVENEPKEDRITGADVSKTMRKLRTHWVLLNWNPTYAECFSFLDKNIEDDSVEKMTCRMCDFHPTSTQLFIEHMVGQDHTLNLKEKHVSMSSFNYWFEMLDECVEKCGKIEGVAVVTAKPLGPINFEIDSNAKAQLNSNTSMRYSREEVLAARGTHMGFKLKCPDHFKRKLFYEDLIDYPLFNVNNEPEEDKITGQDLVDAMTALKSSWVMQNFNQTYSKYFDFLKRQPSKDKTRECVAICRLCNKQPHSANVFFQHLFKQSHIEKLARHNISRLSFKYWEDQFEKCTRKMGFLTGTVVNFNYLNNQAQEKQGSFYESMLEKMPRTEVLEKAHPESITDDPIQYIPLTSSIFLKFDPKKPWSCQLPLFAIGTGGTCGPTNEQVKLIAEFDSDCKEMLIERLKYQTSCRACDVNMSEWSMATVAKHAFSVAHLNKAAGGFTEKDFDWWITTLKINPNTDCSSSPIRLGGYTSIFSIGADFESFSAWQLEQIGNVDESLVKHVEAEILSQFGGCWYCDKWMLTGMDALRHFISEQHFDQVKNQHTVKQFDVDNIMHYVKKCQKDTKCVIM